MNNEIFSSFFDKIKNLSVMDLGFNGSIYENEEVALVARTLENYSQEYTPRIKVTPIKIACGNDLIKFESLMCNILERCADYSVQFQTDLKNFNETFARACKYICDWDVVPYSIVIDENDVELENLINLTKDSYYKVAIGQKTFPFSASYSNLKITKLNGIKSCNFYILPEPEFVGKIVHNMYNYQNEKEYYIGFAILNPQKIPKIELLK